MLNAIIPLITETATGVPPFGPMVEIDGISVVLNNSFDFAAFTKPTGAPTTNFGVIPSSLFNLITSRSAVGAFPITTIPPSINSFDARIDATALVICSFLPVQILLSQKLYTLHHCT